MDNDETQGCTHAIRECRLYTITEAAALLGVCRQTVASYGKLGLIKIINHTGTKPRIFGKDIIKFWKEGK